VETRGYPTLLTRLAFVLIILAVLSTAIVTYILYINFRTEQRNNLRKRLENIATIAGLQQNGDTFEKVQAQNDGFFQQIHEVNLRIKQSEPDLIFVYTMRKTEGGITFVVDAGVPGEPDIPAYGDIYEEPSQTLVDNFDTMTTTVVEPDIYSDEFGSFLSAYTPIFTSNGRRAGVLGVDISAETILRQERDFYNRLILINTVALVVILIAGYLAANYLAKPIVQLRDAANRISKGDFAYKITEIPRTRELAELAIDFNAMTASLSGLINDLERRVADRTEDITRKTEQLRAASYIARQTAEVQELTRLLNTVVDLVTDQFGYYHAGVYLVNEAGDEVTLHAASSEGGKRMMAREHSLKTNMQGIVNYVAAQKKPRIASDIGADAIFFNNPDLPMTRSQIAIPLMVRGRLLGVLDIHSDKPSAFTVQDIDVLGTLADQISVAIDNARLLEESQTALLQLEAITAVRTREAWDQKLKEKQRVVTYTPLGLRAGRLSNSEDGGMSVPVTLRGQKIGGISIARKDGTPWSQQDQELIADVAVQAGLAIENIRLLDEATTRAKQEHLVGGLAFRFSQALDIDSLLQTAARELGQIPGVEETTVIIAQPDDDDANHSSSAKNALRRNGS